VNGTLLNYPVRESGNVREKMNAKYKITIQTEECAGIYCGICCRVCPSEALILKEVAMIIEEKCNGCFKCARNICPNYAITAIKFEEAQ